MTTTKTTLVPLEDHVLVRPIADDDVSKGGVIIPQAAKDKPTRGEVLATGPEVTSVGEGDVVIYSRYAGTDVRVDDEDLLILRKKDLVCRVLQA